MVAVRQASNSLTVDGLLADILGQCINGVNTFDGGLIGSNVTCDVNEKYRRIDGVCNNLKNKDFGATGILMRRMAAPAYADGNLIFETIPYLNLASRKDCLFRGHRQLHLNQEQSATNFTANREMSFRGLLRLLPR